MYIATSAKPGTIAPANRSATVTDDGANLPCASCADWYAVESWSPSSTSTVAGGKICASVAVAATVPAASALL